MSKMVAVTATIIFAVSVASQAKAGTIAVIDQQNTVDGTTNGPDFSGAGQSFTPTLTKIDAADFVFAASSASLQLTLYSGSGIGGSALATSAPETLTGDIFRTVLFNLPSTTLIPGDTYTLFVRALSGAFGQEFSDSNPYPGGEALDSGGGAAPETDLVFAEGTTVPEPSTWAMMALGFGLMGFLGYRKTRSALA